jgi:hypothetical protein
MALCSAVKRVARFPWSGREEEREYMPLYMSQVAYTSEAVAALTRNPEDRAEVFERLVEGMQAMRKAGEATYRAPGRQ